MPGTTTPLPNGLPRLCVTQTRLPSRSPIENEVVWPGSSAARRRLHPLLGRARDRAAVAHAGAQVLDMVVAEQARELLRRADCCWRCARLPPAGWRDRRCRGARRRCARAARDRSLRGCAASAGTGSPRRAAAAHARSGRDSHGDRLLPARREVFEVGHGHAAAELSRCSTMIGRARRRRAAGAFGRRALERARELGLLRAPRRAGLGRRSMPPR